MQSNYTVRILIRSLTYSCIVITLSVLSMPAASADREQFLLFFKSGKSELTEAALRVVGNAAESARANAKLRVCVTGHTDTQENNPVELSRKRADVVADQLVGLGVSRARIQQAGHGADAPMVITAAGVSEPQNRRAVIAIGCPGE